MEDEWTKEWPDEEGYYWFYGWPYDAEKENEEGKLARVNIVQVRKISNGLLFIRDGIFWYKSEGGWGYFKKMDKPKLPELGRPIK